MYHVLWNPCLRTRLWTVPQQFVAEGFDSYSDALDVMIICQNRVPEASFIVGYL
jgi:hypothetical protein